MTAPPFVFGRSLFSALCSDLSTYPISMAVAASAAVPVVFAPIVIQAFPAAARSPCRTGSQRVRTQSRTRRRCFKFFADALDRYRTGEVHYVKLLDGGMVDNYGLAGFTIARLASDTPVRSAGAGGSGQVAADFCFWSSTPAAPRRATGSQTVEGPSGVDLIMATSDTATGSGAIGSYSAFQDTMARWQQSLIDWRCKLSAAERRRYGAPAGWNCRDLKFFVGRVSFDQLDDQRAAKLNAIETAFKLPPDQIDMLISAGHDAVKGSGVFNAFLNSMGGPKARPPRARGRPLVSSSPSQEALAQ